MHDDRQRTDKSTHPWCTLCQICPMPWISPLRIPGIYFAWICRLLYTSASCESRAMRWLVSDVSTRALPNALEIGHTRLDDRSHVTWNNLKGYFSFLSTTARNYTFTFKVTNFYWLFKLNAKAESNCLLGQCARAHLWNESPDCSALVRRRCKQKAADLSKINIRRGEMRGLGHIWQKVHHGWVDWSFVCRSSITNSCKYVFWWRYKERAHDSSEGRENFRFS